MNEWRDLLRRIGGPNALSWSGFWWVLAVNVFISLFTNASVFQGQLPARLIIIAISQVALFVVPFAVWLTWVRVAPAPRPWLMVSAFVVGAVLRGLVVAGGNSVLARQDEPVLADIMFRITASVSIMTVSLVVTAIFNDITREYAGRADELQRVQRDVETVEHDVFERMRATQADALRRIRIQLERLLRVRDPETMVQELRMSVDDLVRPLSHQLAQTIPSRDVSAAVPVRPRIYWPDLLREVGRIELFLPTVTVCITLITAWPWLLANARGPFDLVLLLMTLSSSWVLMWLANRVWLWVSPQRPALVATFALVLAAGIGATWVFTFQSIDPNLTVMVVLSTGYFIVTAWLFSLPRAADRLTRAYGEEVNAAIAALDWELARAQAAAWQQQRSFAYALHGPVQSALTASIFRLESAIRSDEITEELRASIERELIGTLNRVSEAGDTVTPFADVVDEIARLWDGIATFECIADDDVLTALERDSTANAVFVDLTREACSDAIRHGRAKSVVIRLSRLSENLVELVIANDGDDLPSQIGSGLGTQLLTEATVSWSRTRRGPLTVLTAAVPVQSG